MLGELPSVNTRSLFMSVVVRPLVLVSDADVPFIENLVAESIVAIRVLPSVMVSVVPLME